MLSIMPGVQPRFYKWRGEKGGGRGGVWKLQNFMNFFGPLGCFS